MINSTTKTDSSKSKVLLLIENILFVCCVVVIVLRATYTEAPTPLSTQIQAALNDTVYSLALSGVLILAFLLWFLARLFCGRVSLKITSMQTGLGILLLGAILASHYASNKRAAISVSLILTAPLLMAAMLTKLLDSPVKIKILLIAVISLGVVASWQSADQFFISNDIMLNEYKDDPNTILEPLGIAPGTINQMMLEHRIYSKDVRASFTTSNSAGSFAILTSFAAVAILAELVKRRKTSPLPFKQLFLAGCVLSVVLFGLFITRSKGAIASFVFAMVIFALLLRGNRPKLLKNIILACLVIGLVAVIPVIAWYGLKFGRLPGGNSMLVRWQYWLASAQMAADHPLTGVGPGNFATLYHHYKPASSLETVSDPHCFILSILTQYGPPGLLGFLIIVLVPLFRISLKDPSFPGKASGPQFKKHAVLCVTIAIIAMFLLRPFIIPPSTAATFDEKVYVLFTEYIAPAAAFAVGFMLLMKALQTQTKDYAIQNTPITSIALLCGLLGVLIHNLIDFAIFEPGVLTAFCAVLGCLIALNAQPPSQLKSPAPAWLKTTACAIVLFIIYAYFNYAFLPVVKSTTEIAQAQRPIALGRFSLAHNLLESATNDDPLSPDAPSMNGRLYLQRPYLPSMKQSEIFDNAEQAFFIAAQRNPEDYKNFESLADTYFLRAQIQPDEKEQWLNNAFESASVAVSLYPGDGDLHIHLAQIAEELAKSDIALKHYQKAIEIEDSFRKQFHRMYPKREVISRMPEEKYLFAKDRVKILSENPPEAK
jgi:O-antigen ligase/tetratricopeptide (TPR) repeat protein